MDISNPLHQTYTFLGNAYGEHIQDKTDNLIIISKIIPTGYNIRQENVKIKQFNIFDYKPLDHDERAHIVQIKNKRININRLQYAITTYLLQFLDSEYNNNVLDDIVSTIAHIMKRDFIIYITTTIPNGVKYPLPKKIDTLSMQSITLAGVEVHYVIKLSKKSSSKLVNNLVFYNANKSRYETYNINNIQNIPNDRRNNLPYIDNVGYRGDDDENAA